MLISPLLLVSLLAQAAPPRKTVFVITDAEGATGVCRQEQTEPTSPELQKLLKGDVNAAVRGFLSAGADQVLVWDGHDGSRTLSAETIEPRARLVMGSLGPTMMLDRGLAAVAFVGQHARANREKAVMAHSYSSLGIQRIVMNGREVGEIETRSALAGWFGVPVVFLSGDQAAADDLHKVVPEAETAVVKEGLGYYACVSLAAEKAQELIEKTAARSFAKVAQVRPHRIEGPVTIDVEYTTRSTLFPEEVLPAGIERVGPRTLRFTGKDFLAAWTLWGAR